MFAGIGSGIVFFIAALFILWVLRGKSFSLRVFVGLIIGIALGYMLKATVEDSSAVKSIVSWYDVVGSGYVRLLRMVSIPLIMVSILSAIININTSKGLLKITVLVIGILIITTGISAGIGIGITKAFNLRADSIIVGTSEQQRGESITATAEKTNLSLQNQILNVIPSNPFAAMTGAGDNATLSVVLFSAMLGAAVLVMRREQKELADKFQSGLRVIYEAVMELTWMVIELTPFGICAIMAKTIALTDYQAIGTLAKFATASYIALGLVLIVHLVLLAVTGLSPLMYLRKAWPTLTFAFTSRTSMGTLPMTIETLNRRMGLSEGLSGFAASLGTSIGQNGCAGIYPAMLAVMIAPTIGINPYEPAFLAQLIVITALTSFGIAGVGGGATFAAIMVLSAMGMPVALAGVLISIEPLIDMGRTAINVSGSMTAGLLSGVMVKEVDKARYSDASI